MILYYNVSRVDGPVCPEIVLVVMSGQWIFISGCPLVICHIVFQRTVGVGAGVRGGRKT